MELAVTADDRTGAMEAAALCADAGLPTVVVSWDGDAAPAGAVCVVTDLRSRHVPTHRAAERLAGALAVPADRRVHKIDSTLRGNWAGEIEALVTAGHRVRLIPAYPAAGRTCVEGVVLVHGVPVAETEFADDPSSPVRSSRPADALARLGDAVEIADAATDDDIERLVSAAAHGTVVAGPAAVVGAVASRLGGTRPVPAAPGLPSGDVLVVCGSRHAASRAQAAAVATAPGVTVLEPPEGLVAPPEVVALELSVRAHDHLAARSAALVILLGGDTADAFVGPRVVDVRGSVGVGMAAGTVRIDGRTQVIVTKPGGFGATNALVDLLATRGPA